MLKSWNICNMIDTLDMCNEEAALPFLLELVTVCLTDNKESTTRTLAVIERNSHISKGALTFFCKQKIPFLPIRARHD